MRSRLLASCCAPATLVVMLAATLFAAQVSYACSMTGRRQSQCCCASAHAEARRSATSQVAAPCCERTIEQDRAPAAVQHRSSTPSLAWMPGPLLAIVTLPHAPNAQHALPAPLARGPPSGPPVYVRTCRYLI